MPRVWFFVLTPRRSVKYRLWMIPASVTAIFEERHLAVCFVGCLVVKIVFDKNLEESIMMVFVLQINVISGDSNDKYQIRKSEGISLMPDDTNL
jgi:hypothetical protein